MAVNGESLMSIRTTEALTVLQRTAGVVELVVAHEDDRGTAAEGGEGAAALSAVCAVVSCATLV